MQSALRSATRRAVGISSRRGVATTTTAAKAATANANASELWLAEKEKEWVAALVQREAVRAQMVAEEEKRRTRDDLLLDRLHAELEEERRARRLDDKVRRWSGYLDYSVLGWFTGAWLATLMLAR